MLAFKQAESIREIPVVANNKTARLQHRKNWPAFTVQFERLPGISASNAVRKGKERGKERGISSDHTDAALSTVIEQDTQNLREISSNLWTRLKRWIGLDFGVKDVLHINPAA